MYIYLVLRNQIYSEIKLSHVQGVHRVKNVENNLSTYKKMVVEQKEKTYLNSKDVAFRRSNFIDVKERSELVMKIMACHTEEQKSDFKRYFEKLENSREKKYKEDFMSLFWKKPAEVDGQKLFEYFKWLHLKIIWNLLQADNERAEHSWTSGWAIIKKMENDAKLSPAAALFTLMHRNAFGPILHHITNFATSTENIKAINSLLTTVMKSKEDLKNWMKWDAETCEKKLNLEHINVASNYFNYYAKIVDVAKGPDNDNAIKNGTLELKLMLKYNVLDDYYMHFMLRACDMVATFLMRPVENEHPFVHTYYMIRAALNVHKMYEKKGPKAKLFSTKDMNKILGVIKMFYCNNLLILIGRSHDNPNLEPDQTKVEKFEELGKLHEEKRHLEMCKTDEAKLACFKFCHDQLLKAQKLLPADDPTLRTMIVDFHGVRNNIAALQQFPLDSSLELQIPDVGGPSRS